MARALIRRWRIPDLLAKPILWHHTPPQSLKSAEPLQLLHRIAFYVGSMHIEHEPPTSMAVPLPQLGQKLLAIDGKDLANVFKAACKEYVTVREFFGHVADGITDIEALGVRVHATLNKLVDQSIEQQLKSESAMSAARFTFCAGSIEVMRDDDNIDFAVAYMLDESGRRQSMHRFPVGSVSGRDILHELSLLEDDIDSAELESMTDYLRALAA